MSLAQESLVIKELKVANYLQQLVEIRHPKITKQ